MNLSKRVQHSRHEHLGTGKYYAVSGKIEIKGGVQDSCITVMAGDYGYEPNGVVHDMTNFLEVKVTEEGAAKITQ